MDHCIYVCNTGHILFPQIRSELLAVEQGGAKMKRVEEQVMAEFLDYPWSLPERELGESDEMIEVGYLYSFFHTASLPL